MKHPLFQGLQQKFMVDVTHTWSSHFIKMTDIFTIQELPVVVADPEGGPMIALH